MDRQPSRIHQTFGETSLGCNATAIQGFFQGCSITTNAALTPETVLQIELLTKLLSATHLPADSSRIFMSVSQLGFLGGSKEQVLREHDAKSVIGNVNNILQELSRPLDSTDASGNTLLAQKSFKANHTERADALAMLGRILDAATEVHINNEAIAYRRSRPGDFESMRMARITHERAIPHCKVRIQAWKSEVQNKKGRKRKYERFSARVDIQPELVGDVERRSCISVYLHQIVDFDHLVARTTLLPPAIIARRMVPDNSPVFQYIQENNFKGFQQLLHKGDASVWDCDSSGRSLITCAFRLGRTQFCRYLIENGADIDCVEHSFLSPGRYVPLLDQTILEEMGFLIRFPRDPKLLDSSERLDCSRPLDSPEPLDRDLAFNECRRMILEAGADPTTTVGERCLFLRMLCSTKFEERNLSKPTVLNLILRHSSHYLRTKERDSMGRTLLLQYCAPAEESLGPRVQGIKTLLQLGFSLDDRDNELNTCLHLSLEHFLAFIAGSQDSSPDDVDRNIFGSIDAMVYMLRCGADINAVNRNGETPADVVHRNIDFPLADYSDGYASLLEVWEDVLDEYYNGTISEEESGGDGEDDDGGGVVLQEEE
ncbi:uncharacterized protein DSM5745_04350 [Aspergillus mulundensis]|uniref:Uncharacterized protein n=1 Tax=Aspergillus mulundensis TaxID=1810919 RepID=A0A3D8SD59_9EURO|nr:hypothetical protein DSM5745_04350 [Aspergillus mulundensis]RDW84024.1 hypothetical protein DSM5745_04350 [Aspergillus mulundensis]